MAQGLDVSGLTPDRMEEFFKVRRARVRTLHLSPRALRVLVEHLDNLGALPAPPALEPTPLEAFLERYRHYLLRERGLGEATAARYFYVAGQFLRSCSGGEGLKLAAVSASATTKFLTVQCAAHSSGWAKAVAVALRCLLRFLHVEGLIIAPLAQAVPTPAGWAGASLPKALKPANLAAVLGSCDRSSGVGRRDYAVLVLLARLGLRAGEVAGLQMADMDWAGGEIRVRGKGPRVDVLPLPTDVGRALADYVTQGRPRARGGALFRRAVAPHEGLDSTSVTGIVYRACERAGLPRVGAHRLRHTAATRNVAWWRLSGGDRPGPSSAHSCCYSSLRQGRPSGAGHSGPTLAGGASMTDLHAATSDYLALRRALGFKLVEAERMLGSFVEHLGARARRPSPWSLPWNGRPCLGKPSHGGGVSG